MWDERKPLNRKVVVKAWRKHGNGAVGGGRKNKTGKMGIIYQLDEAGKETELARRKGTSFHDLSQKLFATNLIPRDVSINSSGETLF